MQRSRVSPWPTGLGEMRREEAAELRLADPVLPAFEQSGRLFLDRVGVSEVRGEPVAEIVVSGVLERGLDGRVEVLRQTVGHRLLLVADPLGHLGDVRLAGPDGNQQEQLVGCTLQRLVRQSVGKQFPGRVGLNPGKEDKPDTAGRHRSVFDGRRAPRRDGRAGLAPPAAAPPYSRSAPRMPLRCPGRPQSRDPAKLRERLLLDRMCVGQVPGQLVAQVVHVYPPLANTDDRSSQASVAKTKSATRTALAPRLKAEAARVSAVLARETPCK